MDESGQETGVQVPIKQKYLLDTCAWLHIFDRTALGVRIAQIIKSAQICTTLVVISEIVDKLSRSGKPFVSYVEYVKYHAEITSLTTRLAISGALTKLELRRTATHASLNDGINLATARALGFTLLTADKDFDGVVGAIVV